MLVLGGQREPEMMKCGHAANSVDARTGKPCCAICTGLTPGADVVDASPPDLTGRKARCMCGAFADSDRLLAFFEYRGPGSPSELLCKNCGIRDHAGREVWTKCQNYEPHGPWELDSYYCGCRGWD